MANDPTESSSSSSQHQHASSSFAAAGDSILSEKVTRALQVRTDTPAMKAALDALALLSTTTSSVVATTSSSSASSSSTAAHLVNSSNNTVMWIDSRSVRVVMEQDALQQALLLQEQLQQLVNQVVELRLGVTQIASIATKVQDAIHTNVVVQANTNSNVMYQPNKHNQQQQQQQQLLLSEELDQNSERSDAAVKEDTFHSLTTITTSLSNTNTDDLSSLEQEQKLAANLYDSFRHRQVSRQRLEAVLTFLEKFDLSEQDARLLDHYAFEDVVLMANGSGGMDNIPVNGMAFLTALHRVRNIRQALGQTFGGTLLDSTTSSSSSSSNSSFGATSALRMMESLAQKQEKAYERLYHWLQKFLHLHTTSSAGGDYNNNPSSSNIPYDNMLQLEDHEDVLDEALIQNVFVKRALHTLQHVPAFYAHTLELIATFRRGRETRKFLLALTSGYSGMPPLELKAHDAVQYVGDMLAFMFQQTNMEADVAKNVLLTPYRERSNSSTMGGGGGGEGDEEHPEDDEGGEAKDDWHSYNRLDYASSPVTSIEDRPMTAAEMVAQAMGGVARPLKSRILQVIANLARRGDDDDEDDEDDDDDHHHNHRGSGRGSRGMEDDLDEEGTVARRKTSQLYEICGLLSFYHSALNKTIQKLQVTPQVVTDGTTDTDGVQVEEEESTPNPLVAAILECWTAATNGYVASLRVYGAMLEQLAVLTGESEASLAHAMMVQLAQVRVASPGFAADMELPNAQHQTVATTATTSSQNAAKALSLEWILETLIDSSLPLCKTLDDALLLKQGLSVAKKSGMSGETAALLEDRIQEQESKLIEGLVEVETTHVLEYCGLGSVATSWKRFRELNADEIGNEAASVTAVMAGHPGLSQNQLEAAMKEFYASLYSPPLPSLERTVENVTLRKVARQKIASNVADFYADLYAHASRPASGYTDLSFLGHTPEQVRTLFSA